MSKKYTATATTRKLFCLAVFFVCVFLTNAQSLTSYSISVPDQYRNKEHLSSLTDGLDISGRYVTRDGFYFRSANAALKDHLVARLDQLGIAFTDFEVSKDLLSNFSTEKAGGNNCGTAQLLCSNTSQSANSSGPGVQELTAANKGCLGVEHQSSWYYVNIQNPGSLSMIINPDASNDDYDFAIWGPFTSTSAAANCPPTTAPARCSYSDNDGMTGLTASYTYPCSWSWGCMCYTNTCTQTVTDFSEPYTGDSWVAPLTVTAGQVYILLVDNYSVSGSGYQMSFGGSAVLGCTPVTLPVELSSFTGTGLTEGNLLKWTTESETNSDRFAVEWTTDPSMIEWKLAGEVKAAGKSEGTREYSLMHREHNRQAENYYRLVQIDQDGARRVYSEKMIVIDNRREIAKPVRILNLLGQEVQADTPGLVIYQFEDGTSLKIFQ